MSTTETAIFAAGCFWGVEADFRAVPGVLNTAVGYSGGQSVDPTYRDVCSGQTGHAEVVRVEFDSAVVSYGELVREFWAAHDPTQYMRQGPDVGSQYRSAIFYTTEEQHSAAEQSKREMEASGTIAKPIVTEISPAGPFYMAEDYHQQYAEKRGHVSCRTR